MRRSLFAQIYLTVIASLVMVVVLSGVFWGAFGRNHFEHNANEAIGRVVEIALPVAGAPVELQRRAVHRLAERLEVDIALYDKNDRPIAVAGNPRRLRGKFRDDDGWHGRRGGAIWSYTLDDGRVLVADLGRRGPRYPFLRLAAFLGLIAVAVGLGAYPFVRRLTRRIETLKAGVERIGSGDLSARVDVSGRDEVAGLAASFNDAAEKIEHLVGAHRMLLANASHELRTPLSRIRLGVDMVKDGNGGEERVVELKRDIAELDDLIDEILLMSRLDGGAEANLSQTVDLLALAAEECARYKDCDLDGTQVEISGDARLLRRMLRNLLDNAHKHGRPPVAVTIDCNGKDVVLVVRDGGTGIPKANRENVFRPFFRGKGNQNVRGYGLGLPLVRQIAEAHGGTVEILNEAAGAAIRVSLPVAH